jgi:hypothetical protein
MLEVLQERFWHTRIKTMFANFIRATESSMCPFYTCKPTTFTMHKKKWLSIWNSSPNNLDASYLSTSFFMFTTSCQNSTRYDMWNCFPHKEHQVLSSCDQVKIPLNMSLGTSIPSPFPCATILVTSPLSS